MDPLSDILNMLGFKSSIYFQKDFCGPWKMSVSDTGFAQFHFIVRGGAVVEHEGRFDHLTTGDLILFPKGAAHAIADKPESPGMPGQDLIAAMEHGAEPFTEGHPLTRMICGHFEYDLQYQHPFVQDLPQKILLRTIDLPQGSLILSLMPLLVNETKDGSLGSDVVTQHLSQALLAAILRAHFDIHQSDVGFYAGLKDAKITEAISAIHAPGGASLTLSELASIAGMSRSSFAAKFKAVLGRSPGEYAMTWNMLKARQALSEGGKSIEEIAHLHGYGSASAFSRAFRETLGVSPSHAKNAAHP